MNQAVVPNSVYSFDRTPCSRFQLKKKKRDYDKTITDLCENDPRWYYKQGEGRGGEASLT